MLAPKPLNSGASRARFLAFTRMSGLAIALTALGYAATYSANVMLARYLAPEHYGDFAVGFAACVQASTLVLLGFGRAVIRFVLQYLRKGHRHSASGIIFIAFAVSLALGLVVPAFGSLLLVVPYSGFSDGSPHWAIYALWIVALYAFLDITAALLRSTGRPMLSIITYYIAPPLIFIAFIFLFATLTVRVDGLVLFATLGLTYMVVVAMTLLYLPRNLLFSNSHINY